MTFCRLHPLNYDPLAWSGAIRRTCRLVVIVLGFAPFVWLDQTRIPVLGWLLYPIESALNALLFVGVATPVRGNGTALLILAPTLAFFALLFAVLHSLVATVTRARQRIVAQQIVRGAK